MMGMKERALPFSSGNRKKDSSALWAGRFELRPESFDLRCEEKVQHFLHEIDLKEVWPDIFRHTQKIPRSLEEAWRQELDSLLAEYKGVYSKEEEGTLVHILFRSLPASMASLKLSRLKEKLSSLLLPDAEGQKKN